MAVRIVPRFYCWSFNLKCGVKQHLQYNCWNVHIVFTNTMSYSWLLALIPVLVLLIQVKLCHQHSIVVKMYLKPVGPFFPYQYTNMVQGMNFCMCCCYCCCCFMGELCQATALVKCIPLPRGHHRLPSWIFELLCVCMCANLSTCLMSTEATYGLFRMV